MLCCSGYLGGENEKVLAYTSWSIDTWTWLGCLFFIPGLIYTSYNFETSVVYLVPYISLLIGILTILRLGGQWIVFNINDDSVSFVNGTILNLCISKKKFIGQLSNLKSIGLIRSEGCEIWHTYQEALIFHNHYVHIEGSTESMSKSKGQKFFERAQKFWNENFPDRNSVTIGIVVDEDTNVLKSPSNTDLGSGDIYGSPRDSRNQLTIHLDDEETKQYLQQMTNNKDTDSEIVQKQGNTKTTAANTTTTTTTSEDKNWPNPFNPNDKHKLDNNDELTNYTMYYMNKPVNQQTLTNLFDYDTGTVIIKKEDLAKHKAEMEAEEARAHSPEQEAEDDLKDTKSTGSDNTVVVHGNPISNSTPNTPQGTHSNHHTATLSYQFRQELARQQMKTREVDKQMPDEFFKDRRYVVEIGPTNEEPVQIIDESREMDISPTNSAPADEDDLPPTYKDRIHYHPSYNSLQYIAHMAAVGVENHSRQISALTVNKALNMKENTIENKKHGGTQASLTTEVQLADKKKNKTESISIQQTHAPVGSGMFIITQNATRERRGSEVELELDTQKYGANKHKPQETLQKGLEAERLEEKSDRVQKMTNQNSNNSHNSDDKVNNLAISVAVSEPVPNTDSQQNSPAGSTPVKSNHVAAAITVELVGATHQSEFTDEAVDTLNPNDNHSDVASSHGHMTAASTEL